VKSLFIILTSFFCYPIFGSFKSCDSSLTINAKYTTGKKPTHELKISSGSISAGGDGEIWTGGLDHLTVQKSIISCAPGVFRCFKEKKGKLPAKIILSFQLTPSKENENAKISDLSLLWKSSASDELELCLKNIWSELKIGVVIDEQSTVAMPVYIK
jgi:hypothetical protein